MKYDCLLIETQPSRPSARKVVGPVSHLMAYLQAARDKELQLQERVDMLGGQLADSQSEVTQLKDRLL